MKRFEVSLRLLFALFFIAAGLNHFRIPAFYQRMIPTALPDPEALVASSGACEIFGGLLLMVPRTRRIAAWGLIALLIAVFPANIQMALHPELFPELNPVALLLRLPLQFVLIAWAWRYTRREPTIASKHEGLD